MQHAHSGAVSPLRHQVAAVSVGLVGGRALLDLAAKGISELQAWQRQVLAGRPAEQTV